ncbi:hypothetical protein NB550_13175 [Vibrio parahaemolyticus]|uniref:hypothetical protein n=1 Tax=Vibrio parahaemolyticus TaxID=670 RepID=UPI00215BADBF|nr:hypothetical protein [Vibrio parahaemolyticus]EKH9208455.1 hypothetical protein [Vibrio parahaemolyticus]MCR9887010.1 hypothetical protein [Vibrio parahaemolyticus]MCR9918447.1 hypothetical protein [Vibrio parahaemolyticus]
MKQIIKKIIEAVEFVEPHSTLIKVKDSELRYISKLLIEHSLVIRVKDNRNVYIAKNHYKLIYASIAEMPEYQKLVKNDLTNQIRNEVVAWKKGKRIKFDTRLADTKLMKFSKILRKQKGTLHKAYIKINGERKESVLIDKRLADHLQESLKEKLQ